MNNIKVFKSSDFIKFPKNEENDDKRIFDLNIFYQKKYNNHSRNDFNNNNYINLKSNINDINNLENRSYILDNDNKELDSILSNDIEAENNIGKYKEKILNRSKIVEHNYKRLNKYQNDIYNKINYKINNDKYNSFIRKDKEDGLIIKTPSQKLYYLNNNDNSRLDYKLNNSASSKNNFQVKYYLSDFSNGKRYNNICNKEYMGKKKTDITNNELINMTENNENGFYDYYKKKLEVLLNNKKLFEDKEMQNKFNKYNSIKKEKNEMEVKNKYFNNLKLQNKLNIKISQLEYKNLLDEQNENNINNKLLNENLTFGDIVENQLYLSKKNNISNRNFLNKNQFVEVNPYNHRNYSIGDTSLKHNPIINPIIQYKFNKYIFPQNS